MLKEPPYGARVRAKARTISGWKGTGTYLGDGSVLKDGDLREVAQFAPGQIAVMRDQTPNPQHAEYVAQRVPL